MHGSRDYEQEQISIVDGYSKLRVRDVLIATTTYLYLFYM